MYQEALMSLISERALIQEAEKRGYTLDNETVKALADQQYQETLAAVERYVLASYPGLEGEELKAQVQSVLASSGNSLESYRQLAERSAMLAALDAGDDPFRELYKALRRAAFRSAAEAASFTGLSLPQTQTALHAFHQLRLIDYTPAPFGYTVLPPVKCSLSDSPLLGAIRMAAGK
jgi:hypothetical protein